MAGESLSYRSKEIWRKRETFECCWKGWPFLQKSLNPQRAPKTVGSPLHKSENSNALLILTHADRTGQLPQPVPSKSSETKGITRRKSFESNDIKNKKKPELWSPVQKLPMQNSIENIYMRIYETPNRQLNNDGNPTNISLYWNFQALARNDSHTQTESTAKTQPLRKIAKSQVFPVQSWGAELVARALQKAQHKQPICPRNEIFKIVNKSTASRGSTAQGEDEVFQASNIRLLPGNRNAIQEHRILNLPWSPIMHSG